MVICRKCTDNSLCARFKRWRNIIFIFNAEINRYVLRCSCPFYCTFSIPCRHVCKILIVTKDHVNIRWWKAFVALYHREGYEKERDEFHKRMYDKLLSISCNEYKQIMEYDSYAKQEYDYTNVNLFHVPFQVKQSITNGLILSQLVEEY